MARAESEEESARQDMMGSEIPVFGRQGSSRVTGGMIPLALGRSGVKVPLLHYNEGSGREASTLHYTWPSLLSVQAPRILSPRRPGFRVALGGHTVEGCIRLRGVCIGLRGELF